MLAVFIFQLCSNFSLAIHVPFLSSTIRAVHAWPVRIDVYRFSLLLLGKKKGSLGADSISSLL